MWTAADIEIRISGDETDDPIVTVLIVTPDGTLKIMAEPEWSGRLLTLRGLHVHGETVGPNGFGFRRLAALARAVMEELDIDGLVVEGEIRTTGAGPGHRPRPVRFTRKVYPARR